MVRINIPKVRGKMGEKGLTITALANKLGIDRNTLSHYLTEPGKTPYNIVADMALILCDTPEEATAIFFDPDLRITKDSASNFSWSASPGQPKDKAG